MEEAEVEGECAPTWLNLKLSVYLAIAVVAFAALLKDYLRLQKEHRQAGKNIYSLRRDVAAAKESLHKRQFDGNTVLAIFVPEDSF